MTIQWKAGLPYEDGRAMDYDALATWARSLEAGLEQLAQLPEGGSARALLGRSRWMPTKQKSPYTSAYGETSGGGSSFIPNDASGGGHSSLPSTHKGPCVVKR